jgi:hypothetical protein
MTKRAVLIVIGLVLTAWGGSCLRTTFHDRARVAATCIVTWVFTDKGRYGGTHVKLSHDAAGKHYESRESVFWQGAVDRGDAVACYYDPNDPTDIAVEAAWFGGEVPMTIVGVILLLLGARRPKRRQSDTQ